MPKRTDIRIAFKALCTDIPGITTVYLGRQRAIPVYAMPALCIYLENEEKQLAHMGKPRVFDRGLDIVSEIHVQAETSGEVEDLLDAFCEAREVAVLADETLGGIVASIFPTLDEYEIEEDGVRPAGLATCRDTITYSG